MITEYNDLDCGCKYEIGNYEDNIFCSKHTKHSEIRGAIAEDVRRIIREIALKIKA
jgi:hypothetical protein